MSVNNFIYNNNYEYQFEKYIFKKKKLTKKREKK